MRSLEELFEANHSRCPGMTNPVILEIVEEWLSGLAAQRLLSQAQETELASYIRVRTQRDRTVRNLQDHGTCWICGGKGRILVERAVRSSSGIEKALVDTACQPCNGTGRNS